MHDPTTDRGDRHSGYFDAMRILDEALDNALGHIRAEQGPDHPDTLQSRNNLALAYQAAGRAGEAIPLHEQALATRERTLGPDHPDTLQSRNNLTEAYQAVSFSSEARKPTA